MNILSRHVPEITHNIQEVANEQHKLDMKVFKRIDTNELPSDSSGNESVNDPVNKIYEMQKQYTRSQS